MYLGQAKFADGDSILITFSIFATMLAIKVVKSK
jgi:hypothetical protein